MLDIFVRIKKIDMNGFCGREHHPTKEMEGRFVRITKFETVPNEGDGEPYQVFYGIIQTEEAPGVFNDHDAGGNEGAAVELISHELESWENVLRLWSRRDTI